MTEDGLSNQRIRDILESAETIAMVGLSGNWSRPSYFAAKYLMEKGYTVIPVNPNYKEILGKKSFPSLQEIDRPVDVVNLFQRSEKVSDFLEDAMALKASAFWMQLGIVNKQAGEKAVELGMIPVMDRCMKIEYARLFGGLTWSGVNTGIISAKRPNKIP
ncbi:MAG: CoA-binding protein [Pseudomonadota bacterium]|jgi:predicted CoA-binding protein|nr:CoA-binding protein [Pseudomonadota bacterium]